MARFSRALQFTWFVAFGFEVESIDWKSGCGFGLRVWNFGLK